ncbi:copper amine oxidase N-terminal domain-containing protein [Paenibacillus profundus]|uniref:Copper amine oxidase N-terminal domain-containing protein n=1 Tax=Paenibacillus profundus TaxID=1173085 RepID=A0ABS8YKH1_9BACL|nr:stalk domain-containing protein [Paenibacillus profundus]MCE5172052.1 copper amine oxidase N-terminal domain-containing protein [Paenibacillus profundus]
MEGKITMKKLVTGFICGAIFFSGIAFAASNFTAKVEEHKIYINGQEKALSDKPVSIEGNLYLPVRELADAIGYRVAFENGDIKLTSKKKDEQKESTSSGSTDTKFDFQKLPITQTVKDVEVTVHSVRLTEGKTDFEITIKNNTADENITPVLGNTEVGANYSNEGKSYETVGISPANPDFEDGSIKPKKEKHGWVSNQGLADRDVKNLTFSLSVNGKKEKRTFKFYIDCKDLKFRTL